MRLIRSLAAAVVTGSTVLLAAAADLASSPTKSQRFWLWCLACSGILLGIVTYLVIDRLNQANRKLQRGHLQSLTRLDALQRQIAKGDAGARFEYARSRAQRRIRRAITASISDLPSGGGLWRFGVWAVDSSSWLLPPLQSDSMDALASTLSWSRPRMNGLPERVLVEGVGSILEFAKEVPDGGLGTFYCALQFRHGVPVEVSERSMQASEAPGSDLMDDRSSARAVLERLVSSGEVKAEIYELAAIAQGTHRI